MNHNKINLTFSGITNVQNIYEEPKWNFSYFKKAFNIQITDLSDNFMEFDIIGCDASLVNSIRRLLIAEVPTMAIEHVFLYNNTSVIQDEVLCHRLGLIPLKVDPRLFSFKSTDEPVSANNTLVFSLNVKCTNNSNEDVKNNDKNNHSTVYSGDLVWQPFENQEELFKDTYVGPVQKDIVIAKLKPGQVIDLKVHAVKGIGSDHAKFSPVCTASYRLLPEIILKKDVYNDDALSLQKCFSRGVIELKDENGNKKAFVENSRLDQCSRNVFRHNELKDAVELNKIRDHYIFSIDSTGALTPSDLFEEAVKIMINKCKHFLKQINSVYE